MLLYHRTDHAQAILRDGFADGDARESVDGDVRRGVWLSTRPVEFGDDVGGKQLLIVDLDDEVAERYRLPSRRLPFFEFCVPAGVLNRHARCRIADDASA